MRTLMMWPYVKLHTEWQSMKPRVECSFCGKSIFLIRKSCTELLSTYYFLLTGFYIDSVILKSSICVNLIYLITAQICISFFLREQDQLIVVIVAAPNWVGCWGPNHYEDMICLLKAHLLLISLIVNLKVPLSNLIPSSVLQLNTLVHTYI